MTFGEDLLSLVFPRRCPVCDGIVQPRGALICPECRAALRFVREPVCRKCGAELDDTTREYCPGCMRHHRSFEHGVALLNYEGPAADSIARIKYHGRREYLDYYAEEAAKRCGARIRAMQVDCLIPVPVHPSRKRQRGFNQAEVLADKLGEKLGIPVVPDLLIRSKKTAPSKQLNPEERLKNLTSAFGVNEKTASELIPGSVRRVLIVDDIYTTGATLEACTRILLGAGVEKVWFFVIGIGHAM